MPVKVKMIEEFSDEVKFAKGVEDYLNTIKGEREVHFGTNASGKGFLYIAMIISESD